MRTTRLTGGFLRGYKSLIPPRVSRRGLSYYQLSLEGIFICFHTQFIQCHILFLLFCYVFFDRCFILLQELKTIFNNCLTIIFVFFIIFEVLGLKSRVTFVVVTGVNAFHIDFPVIDFVCKCCFQ